MSSFASKIFATAEATCHTPFVKHYPLNIRDIYSFQTMYETLYEQPLYQIIQHLSNGDNLEVEKVIKYHFYSHICDENDPDYWNPQIQPPKFLGYRTNIERFRHKSQLSTLMNPPANLFNFTPVSTPPVSDAKAIRQALSTIKKQRNILAILLHFAIITENRPLITFLINPTPDGSSWLTRLDCANHCIKHIIPTTWGMMEDLVDLADIDMKDTHWFKYGVNSNETISQTIIFEILMKFSPKHLAQPYQFMIFERTPDQQYGLAWWKDLFSYGRYPLLKSLWDAERNVHQATTTDTTDANNPKTQLLSSHIVSIITKIAQMRWIRTGVILALSKACGSIDDVEMFTFAIELIGGWDHYWHLVQEIDSIILQNRLNLVNNPIDYNFYDFQFDYRQINDQATSFETITYSICPKIISYIRDNDHDGIYFNWLGTNSRTALESLINFHSRALNSQQHSYRSDQIGKMLLQIPTVVHLLRHSRAELLRKAAHTPTTPFLKHLLEYDLSPVQIILLSRKKRSPFNDISWSKYFTTMSQSASLSTNSFNFILSNPYMTISNQPVLISIDLTKAKKNWTWLSDNLSEVDSSVVSTIEISLPPIFILITQQTAALELLTIYFNWIRRSTRVCTRSDPRRAVPLDQRVNISSYVHDIIPKSHHKAINRFSPLHLAVAVAISRSTCNEDHLCETRKVYNGPKVLEVLLEAFIEEMSSGTTTIADHNDIPTIHNVIIKFVKRQDALNPEME